MNQEIQPKMSYFQINLYLRKFQIPPKKFFFSLLVSLSQNQGFVFIESICTEQFNILHILQYLFKINFEIFLHYFFAAIKTFNYIDLERH